MIDRYWLKIATFNRYYRQRWSDYCTKCGGWGEWYTPGSYWEPPDGGPCSCVEDGVCPRCGKETIGIFKQFDIFHDDKDQCTACGWTTGDKGIDSEMYDGLIE